MLQSVIAASTNKLPAKLISKHNDPKMVANYSNAFFCTIGKKLADKILDNENHTFLNYLSNCISQSIYLKRPELNQNINNINSFNLNKVIGHDNITAFPLKIVATNTAPCLQCFFYFLFSHNLNTQKRPQR